MMSCPREVGDRTINQFGADFRYAVEFSKNGHTPAPVSRPAWGQPCKHYPARFAVSTARPDPLCSPSPARRQPNPCGSGLRGVSLPGPSGTVAARLGEQYGHGSGNVKPAALTGFSAPLPRQAAWRPTALGDRSVGYEVGVAGVEALELAPRPLGVLTSDPEPPGVSAAA